MKNKKSSQVFETYTGYYGVADEEQKKKVLERFQKQFFGKSCRKVKFP